MAEKIDFRHVREHADFVAVAAHYGITLTRTRGTSTTQLVGLCPFHEDHTPSLIVNTEKNLFNCFPCGVGGNVLDFVARMEDSELRPAARKLAEICGLSLAPEGGGAKPRKKRPEKAKEPSQAVPEADPLTEHLEATPDAPEPEETSVLAKRAENPPLTFRLQLDHEHAYLDERGVSLAARETFGIGFARRGIMAGRIAIPIWNVAGNAIIAYAGRWAAPEPPEGKPRYLLPKGFRKELELFNLHRVPDDCHEVVLVESFFSVIRIHELGIAAVSPMGCSFSAHQIGLLLRHGVTRVTVFFDGDDAGRKGTATAMAELVKTFFVHVPEVPNGFKPHQADEATLRHFLGG